MRTYLSITACVAAVSVLHAATEEELCRELSALLKREADVLAAVQDAGTAASAVAPLQEVLGKLIALNERVNDDTLWNYIDSTEGVKPGLMGRLRALALEFTRLEKAGFYGNSELAAALAPQLNPNAETPDAE